MGRPEVPQDLLRHNCLTLAFHPGYARWPFHLEQNGTPTRLDVAVRGNLSLDNGESLRDFARRGAGLARLSGFHIAPDLKDGSLLPVLQEFNPGDTEPVWVIYADQSPVAARVRAFVDFLSDRIAQINS
jgi:DNA-binding transcriptional LysR family regulator